VRVLVAPDTFKGTLTAAQAGEAIAAGWRRVRPGDDVSVLPLADGGDGTLDALVPREGGPGAARIRRRVTGPLGDPVDAELGIRDGAGVVEMARASGLTLVAAERRDPRRATTRGTGELMRAALDAGARELLVCLGGSATNDGGVGMASALGVRFLDAAGRPLPDGGLALLDLASIDARGLDPRLASAPVLALTDVDAPLTGPRGASVVFGPQKGAAHDEVLVLDRALGHLAAVVYRDLGVDIASEAGAGAAGGLGFGLLAFCGARIRPGVEVVMAAVGFVPALEAADLVVTGEGTFDPTSTRGKVVGGVIEAAALAGVPVAVVCGRADAPAPTGAVLRTLVDRVGEEAALRDARRAVTLVAGDLAADVEAPVG